MFSAQKPALFQEFPEPAKVEGSGETQRRTLFLRHLHLTIGGNRILGYLDFLILQCGLLMLLCNIQPLKGLVKKWENDFLHGQIMRGQGGPILNQRWRDLDWGEIFYSEGSELLG